MDGDRVARRRDRRALGRSGTSRIVRVDPATGSRTEIWRSGRTITDLATSRQPASYLWVAGGTIHWNVGGTEGSLARGYDKAAFFPG